MHYIDLTDPMKPPPGIEFLFFPGGEPHVKLDTIEDDKVFVGASITQWEFFGELVVLLNALHHQNKEVTLFIPYFPGARQDRNPGGNTPLTVEIYGKILAPYVNHLIVFDLHSHLGVEILSKLFPKVSYFHPFQIPEDLLPEDMELIDGIIVPDKGAVERATLVAAHLYHNCPIVQCEKIRDFDSGKILGFEMPALPSAGSYLVVDDICDGGWTFNELAEAFSKDPHFQQSELHLYISHGIFSKGLQAISPIYDSITCTDSFYEGPWRKEDNPYRVDPYVIPLDFITQMHLKEN